MKYIRTSEYEIILFPNHINHDTFKDKYDIVSAGYVDFEVMHIANIIPKVYGDSYSLDLVPLENDAELIKEMIDIKRNI